MKKTLNILSILIALAGVLSVAGCTRTMPLEAERTVVQAGEVSFAMLSIPALEYPGGELGTEMNNETRADTLTIERPYRLAETNTNYRLWVTVRDWAQSNGYSFNRVGQMGSEADGIGMTVQHPVTFVDWSSAAAWCNALTEMHNALNGTELRPVYERDGAVIRNAADAAGGEDVVTLPDADGFRLPTGNEWEVAARYTDDSGNGKNTEFPEGSGRFWQSYLSVCGELEAKESDLEDSRMRAGRIQSIAVDKTPVTALGFYGFAGKEGKLWQWCNEYVEKDYNSAFHLKRGGSMIPFCGRHDGWPRENIKWDSSVGWPDTKREWKCRLYDQLTFRVAQTILP